MIKSRYIAVTIVGLLIVSIGVVRAQFLGGSGAGNVAYATMHINASAVVTDMTTVGDVHPIVGQFSLTIANDGATVSAGETGNYTAVAQNGSDITVTAAGHGLAVGEIVVLNDGNYDGAYTVTRVDGDDFDVTATFGATDSGVYTRPDVLSVITTGLYDVSMHLSASPAVASKVFVMQLYKDVSAFSQVRTRRAYGATDIGSISGGAHGSLTAGDAVWVGVTQETAGVSNITISDAQVILTRIGTQ
jgi:hypothetical protein